jgi:hypothetical protein
LVRKERQGRRRRWDWEQPEERMGRMALPEEMRGRGEVSSQEERMGTAPVE